MIDAPAQACRVDTGRDTELALVLPAELRGAVVPHPVADAGHVVRPVGHHQPRRLQPDLLLELDRAHRRHRMEVPVERGDAHPGGTRQVLHPEGLGVVVPDPADRPGHVVQAAVGEAQLTDRLTLFPRHQQPEDLPLEQRDQHPAVARPVQQTQQADDGVDQLGRCLADRDPRPGRPTRPRQVARPGPQHQLRDDGRLQFAHADPAGRAARRGTCPHLTTDRHAPALGREDRARARADRVDAPVAREGRPRTAGTSYSPGSSYSAIS